MTIINTLSFYVPLYCGVIDLEKYHLKSISLLESLNVKDRSFIKDKMTRVEFKKRQVIFKEGGVPKGIYIIRKGKIKLVKNHAQGHESIIYICKKGDYFGHRPVLAQGSYTISAVAMDSVVVNFIPKDVFLNLYENSDSLPATLSLTLAQEFSVWINKITIFTEYSVKERVALSLLILNQIYRKDDEERAIITIGRDDLANYVGTAKESLVRTLRLFKDEKIISTNNTKIVVLKPELLHKLF